MRRPLTRSAIKPKLLFPTRQQAAAKMSHNTEDEEADTDIEDHTKDFSTPKHQVEGFLPTPKAPRFAPATPPTTARATRSKNIDISSSPAGPTSSDDYPSPLRKSGRRGGTGRPVSPFDEWVHHRPLVNKKREGSPIRRENAKKSRG